MASCAKCGATLGDNAAFCAACGTSAGANAGASQAAAPASATGSGIPPNIAALLCYIVWPIICVLFLILEPYNKDKFVRFHAFQSLFLGLFSIGLAIGLVILTTILALIPVLGWILNFLVWIAYTVIVFGLVIFLMYKAYNRELYMLPWVGKLAAQQAGR
jgi:uncharacterized membrane protein